MNQPLVSVCVVSYNQAEFIGTAFTSALEQDYDNLEVVVADDGSKDGTADVIRQYSCRYGSRFVSLPEKVNEGIQGIFRNYNRALKAARGKYICILEGDDVYLPGKIARQVEWLEADKRRVLCGHDVEVFDSNTDKRLYLWSERFPLRAGRGARAVVMHNVPFCTVSIMMKSSAVPREGLDDRLRVIGDWKLWIDCLADGGEYGYVNGVYARYRRHAHNITNSHSIIRQTDQFVTLGIVESQYPYLSGACRHGRATLYYAMGLQSLLLGERASSRVHLMNALRQYPHWKSLRAMLLSLMPTALQNRALAPLRQQVRTQASWSERKSSAIAEADENLTGDNRIPGGN